MRYLAFISVIFLILGCPQANPVFTNIVGHVKDSTSLEGIDGIVVVVRDLDPDDRLNWRIRRDTTESVSGDPGWYAMDRVCFGDEESVTWIIVGADSSDNPGYKTRALSVTVTGPVDTIRTLWLIRD